MNANDNKGKGPTKAKIEEPQEVRGGTDAWLVHQERFKKGAPNDKPSVPSLSSEREKTL